MRSLFSAPVLIAALIAPSTKCNAGAFNEGVGRGLFVATQSMEIASSFLSPTGMKATIARYERRERSLYFEYGLSSQLTFLGRASGTQVSLDRTIAFDGRGPSDFGLQLQLLRRANTAVAIQAFAHLPSRDLQPGNWIYGQRRTEPEVRALIGQSLFIAGKKNYYEVQLGLRGGRKDRPDELHLDVTHAVTLGARTSWMTQVFLTRTSGESRLPAQAFAERKIQVSLLREFGPYSLQIGTFRTSSGKNVFAGKGAIASLWMRL